MEQFYASLSDILSYVAGEEIALKPITLLNEEITALIGTGDLSWLSYFIAPLNALSLFVHGGLIYAVCWLLLYLPWRMFRTLIGFGGSRERRVRK